LHAARVQLGGAFMGVKPLSPWNAKRARTQAAGRVRAVSMGVKPLVLLGVLAGCIDLYSDAVRWPAQGTGIPPQPVSESLATGVSLRALAIEWTPDAIVVELELDNQGEGTLVVERAAIMFAWDELEYAPQASDREAEPEPARLELEPGQRGVWRLRYQLGRALTGPGSCLLVRHASRDGVAIVELPQLEIPAIPSRD
jgi:hypothetical protein